jgi:hypothetical protein
LSLAENGTNFSRKKEKKMKTRQFFARMFLTSLALVLVLAGSAGSSYGQERGPAAPLDTGFTYQGRLTDGGSPANGTYDFEFSLYDAASDGSQVGSTVTQDDVAVSNGTFIVQLDFGSSAFDGSARWMAVGVRAGSSTGAYTTLTPRQALTAAPYALYAPSAGSAASAPWSGLSGVPADLSDGDDADTLGELACSGGQLVEWDGSAWACADDADTTYTAGAGLLLSSGQFSVVTSTVQQRVSGTCASGSAIRTVNADGTVTCEAASGSAWSLSGNSGTNPTTHFVGTTDNQPLVIKSNNVAAMHIYSDAVGIGTVNPQAKLDVNGGIKVNGGIMLPLPVAQTAMIFNDPCTGSIPDDDGFRLLYDNDFFATDDDALVFEKTDNNDADPDGGIAFANTGSDGVRETALSIRGDGNIGVGTSSNLYPGLNIKSITTTGEHRGGLWFQESGSGDMIFAGLYLNSNNDLALKTWSGSSWQDVFAIDHSSGDIGVGITNPTSSLHVVGNAERAASIHRNGDTQLNLESDGGNETYIQYANVDTSSNAWMAGMDDDETFRLAFGAKDEINDSKTALIIQQDGNVSLGTTAHSARLTIGSVGTVMTHSHGAVYIASGNTYFDYLYGLVFRGTGDTWATRFTGTDNMRADGEIVGIYKEESTPGDTLDDAPSQGPVAVFKNDGSVGIGTNSNIQPGLTLNSELTFQESAPGTLNYARLYLDSNNDLVIGNYTGSAWQDNVTIERSGDVGIGQMIPGAKLDVNGTIHASGDLTADGTKPAVVDTQDYGRRKLYAMESPSVWFEDFGTAQLVDGEAVVTLDPVFAQTINLDETYHVYLTPLGDCALYVADKGPTTFTVRAMSGQMCSVAFDYRIVARRLGYEDTRLEAVETTQGH